MVTVVHVGTLPLDDGVEHAVDENFGMAMNDITELYQSLQDSQQRTDLIEALRDLMQSYAPVDLEKLLFPKAVATKGRSKTLKGSRNPSRFEIAEKEDKARERADSKEDVKDDDMHTACDKGDNVDEQQKSKKRRNQFADTEELWPKE